MNDFQRDEWTGLWKWPVLLNGDWSQHSNGPCAVLFGRSQDSHLSLQQIPGLDLPARWPHLQMFSLDGGLLVLAQGYYLPEQALLFAEDVNRQLREVHLRLKRDLCLTWGVTVPENENWNLPDALAEAFSLTRRAAEEGRLASINIADDGWQNNPYDDLVVCTPRDELTSLWSWRSVAAMRLELNDEPLALLMGDIDKIKTLNDNFGIPMGEAAIAAVAEVLRSLQSVDVSLFRWGGDKFILWARGFSLESAQQMAEEINGQLREKELSVPYLKETIPALTLTWGVVCSTDVQLEAMLRQADELMLAAKASNRRGSVNS